MAWQLCKVSYGAICLLHSHNESVKGHGVDLIYSADSKALHCRDNVNMTKCAVKMSQPITYKKGKMPQTPRSRLSGTMSTSGLFR